MNRFLWILLLVMIGLVCGFFVLTANFGCTHAQRTPTLSQTETLVDTQTKVIGKEAKAIQAETQEPVTKDRAGVIVDANDTLRTGALPGIRAAEKESEKDKAEIIKLKGKYNYLWTWAAIAGVFIFAGGVALCFYNRGIGISVVAGGLSVSVGVIIYQALTALLPWIIGGVVVIVIIALVVLAIRYRGVIKELVKTVDVAIKPALDDTQKRLIFGVNEQVTADSVQSDTTKKIVAEVRGK
jgi:hypothetical protein